jgi:hypothetical protein
MVDYTLGFKPGSGHVRVMPSRPIIYLQKMSPSTVIETDDKKSYSKEFNFCFFCGAGNKEKNNSTDPIYQYCCESFRNARKAGTIGIIENNAVSMSSSTSERNNEKERIENDKEKEKFTFIFNLARRREYQDFQEKQIEPKRYDQENPYEEVYVEYCPYCGLHLESHIFEALGYDKRLKIAQMLLNNPSGLGVAEMAGELRIANEACNVHLYVLESSGFVYHEKIISRNDRLMNNFRIIPEKRNVILNLIATIRSEGAMIVLVSSPKHRQNVGQQYFFKQNEIRIGRCSSPIRQGDICLENDTNVTRFKRVGDKDAYHAKVFRKNNEYFIEDMMSKNGTLVIPNTNHVPPRDADEETELDTIREVLTEPGTNEEELDNNVETVRLNTNTRMWKLASGDEFEIGTTKFVFINPTI